MMGCPMGAFRHECCNEAERLREENDRLREERDRFQAYVHSLQPILDPAALGKDADGYRDTALALTRERDEAREVTDLIAAEVVPQGFETVLDAVRRVCRERDEARALLSKYDCGLTVEAQGELAAKNRELLTIVAKRSAELEQTEAEVARLEGLILEAEADIKAMGMEAHPAVLMRLDRLVRSIRAAKGE